MSGMTAFFLHLRAYTSNPVSQDIINRLEYTEVISCKSHSLLVSDRGRECGENNARTYLSHNAEAPLVRFAIREPSESCLLSPKVPIQYRSENRGVSSSICTCHGRTALGARALLPLQKSPVTSSLVNATRL